MTEQIRMNYPFNSNDLPRKTLEHLVSLLEAELQAPGTAGFAFPALSFKLPPGWSISYHLFTSYFRDSKGRIRAKYFETEEGTPVWELLTAYKIEAYWPVRKPGHVVTHGYIAYGPDYATLIPTHVITAEHDCTMSH